MPDTRTRDLVAKEHQTWASYDPDSITSTVLRALLWEIDHPALADQTPAVYAAWLDKVEPRDPNGELEHPAYVAELKRDCEEIHGQH